MYIKLTRLLFAIIGTQSFKSSLRRTCVWVDPEGIEANYTTQQFCGSYLDPQTWTKRPYVFMDGMPSSVAKGFTCPAQSLCVSNENPYGGTVSFDNIFYSLEMVFVVMSTNTYTDIMYDTMNTDYVVSSLFFIIGVVVLSFWLINLLIAVIASSFRLVRDERMREKQEKSYMKQRNTLLSKNTLDSVPHLQYLLKSKIGIWYYRTRIIWPILIMVDLVIQSIYGSTPTASTMQVNYHWQIWMNVIFTIEIIIRFIAYLPFWRVFFASKRNLVDLFLVIINFIILLPFVHDHSELYSWLTAFQIMRFYRNAVSFPFARDLWRKVLGNYRTIFNLAVFLFLLTFLCSILASQLFSGVVPLYSEGDVNIYSFFDLADSFVSMYIILSTENWTEITYPAIQSAPNVFVGACFGAFFIIWFIVSSFIVLSMFIAVIAENLDISTELKRSEQLKAFVKEYASASSARETFTNSFASVKNYIFKQIGKEEKQRKDGLNSGEAVFDLLLQKRVVEEFLDKSDPTHIEIESTKEAQQIKSTFVKKIVQTFKRGRFDNPFDDKYALHEKIRRDMLNIEDSNGIRPTDFAQEFIKMRADLEERQIKFLKEHPKYDYSLNIFGPDNKLRQICQRIVEPSYGRRNSGIVPSRSVWYSFWLFMFLCSNALVIATCINTPLYLKQISENLSHKWSWTVYADLVFVIIFTTEASIKIIADGLITPPNAYWRSTWNKIDLLVLNMLWITFLNEAFSTGYISRYIRAIEALRALRLMTVSAQAQATFHDVIISGIGKIFSATVISLLLLFPFSVWGLNLYSGKLSFCTDSNIGSFSDCVDEYLAEPFNWEIYAPRAITKTYYDYDTFWHSFLITFEVISLEGWVDVLGSVIAITGSDSNPIPLASRYNGIFPIFYNIIAITFILTLFVAVIIKNYAQIRGTAFLTDEQLSWYEVQKMLETVKPSIRYPKAKVGSLRELFQRQIEERKSWMKYIDSTILLVIVLIVLIQYYPSPKALTTVQNVLLLVFILFYLVLYIFKIYAMGFKKFLNKKWMIYGVIISLAALASTIADLKLYQSEIYTNFQKVAIIGMLLLCIPKSRRLDKLFKTASASFRVIGDLMFTWFILFLVYAIAFNQVFGLTRIGPNGDQNLNFRTVPKALILLFRMSCGEGWNQILNDYLVSPPYCVSGSEFEETDCGSHPFAYFLFISWNILSMYIFVNMFVSLIYENFRYVFHHGGVRISRRDIKLFKKAWLEFDPQGTGYIDPSNLHKLLHRCEGYFSMSIYYGNYTVSNLLKKAMIDRKDSYDVDYVALNSVMRNYPGDVFKKRRQLYELFCEQALEEAHPSKGISFSALLHQFPLYKDIDYSKYLK